MRIVFGLTLVAIGFCWGAFWSAGAAMTTETGIWNSATWAVLVVAALGLIPFAGGVLPARAPSAALGAAALAGNVFRISRRAGRPPHFPRIKSQGMNTGREAAATAETAAATAPCPD